MVSGGVAWSMLQAGTLETADLYRETILISVRLAVGLLVPLVFAYMVWETVRLRATQSATGILYFAMVLAYVGELTGLYLARETGVPF